MMQLTPAEQKARDDHEKYVEAINSGSKWRKWGAVMGSDKFNKSATKYYVLLYGLFLCYGIWYFRKLFILHLEEQDLEKMRDNGVILSEYQKLRLREIKANLIRTTDKRKLQAYYQLKKAYDAQSEEEKTLQGPFNPAPEEIKDIVDLEYKNSILPASDLSEFYDGLAETYDKDVGSEEWLSFMNGKRKWLMSHVKGDVLEVASGTGRNIDLIDPMQIKSYTFLDASKKMMEVCFEKFKERWPDFPRVKFVVGKAEDLISLSKGENTSTVFKYDTIIETFGICSHENPVVALQNMRELLKPNGRIILLEHGRGSFDWINDILDGRAHKHSAKWGCRWNLDIGEIVDESGLEITEEKRAHFGTTWMIVCKRPEDVAEMEELSWFQKYIAPAKTNLDSSKPITNDK